MSTCPPQYVELRPTNGWDRFGSLGHPRKFQLVSRLGFVTAARSLARGQPNFAWCLVISWAGTLYIHFWGFCPWQNFARYKIDFTSKSCVLLHWQRYCTALQQRGQPNLAAWHKELNYGTFAERPTYIRQGGHHVGHRPTFYTWVKKGATLTMAITLSILDRFAKFFHGCKEE